MKTTVLAFLTASFALSSTTFAADSSSAHAMKSGINSTKAKIENILRSQHFTLNAEANENDGPALSALMKAGDFLGRAGESIDISMVSYDAGDIDGGNYSYAVGCSRTGIARSSLARSNIAASTPPLGRLSAFSQEIKDVLDELTDLRTDGGCP